MNGEPDLTATFQGGPNDGHGIPLYGSPSKTIHTGGGGGHYELDLVIWNKKGVAIYSWHEEGQE